MRRVMIKWIIPGAMAVAAYALLKDFFVPHGYVWCGFATVWALASAAHAVGESIP